MSFLEAHFILSFLNMMSIDKVSRNTPEFTLRFHRILLLWCKIRFVVLDDHHCVLPPFRFLPEQDWMCDLVNLFLANFIIPFGHGIKNLLPVTTRTSFALLRFTQRSGV